MSVCAIRCSFFEGLLPSASLSGMVALVPPGELAELAEIEKLGELG